jgi:hypothetical protein
MIAAEMLAFSMTSMLASECQAEHEQLVSTARS